MLEYSAAKAIVEGEKVVPAGVLRSTNSLSTVGNFYKLPPPEEHATECSLCCGRCDSLMQHKCNRVKAAVASGDTVICFQFFPPAYEEQFPLGNLMTRTHRYQSPFLRMIIPLTK